MKKIAIFTVVLAIVINIVAAYPSATTDWLNDLEQPDFVKQSTEESLLHTNEVLEASHVSNVEDILTEAYLISFTASMSERFMIVPTYIVEHKYPQKTRAHINKIKQEFVLPGYHPVYRELLAHRIAEILADNEVVDNLYDEKNTKITFAGCRITWGHHGEEYYLMDKDLDFAWDLAGHGDFPAPSCEPERRHHDSELLRIRYS